MDQDEPADGASAHVGMAGGSLDQSTDEFTAHGAPTDVGPREPRRRGAWNWRSSVPPAAESADPEDAPIGTVEVELPAVPPAGSPPSWPAASWAAAPNDFRLTAPDDDAAGDGPAVDDGGDPNLDAEGAAPRPFLRRPAVIATGVIGGIMLVAMLLVLGPLRPSSATAVLPVPQTPRPTVDPATIDPGVAAARAFLKRIADPAFTYRMVWTGRANGPGDRISFKATYDVAGRDYAGRLTLAGNGTTSVIVKGPAVFMKRGSRPWTRITSGLENIRQYPFLGIARPADMAYVGPVDAGGKAIGTPAPGASGAATLASAAPAAGTAAPSPKPAHPTADVSGLAPAAAAPSSTLPAPTAKPARPLYLLRSTGSYRPIGNGCSTCPTCAGRRTGSP